MLFAGLGCLWFIASNKWVDRHLSSIIGWMLRKYTNLDARDYISLLHMAGEYKVVELYIEEGDWLAEKSLSSLDLTSEGFLVLGITRKDGSYIGAPNGNMKLLVGDNLVIYGREPAFEKLDQRQKGFLGDREHEDAVFEQSENVGDRDDSQDDMP